MLKPVIIGFYGFSNSGKTNLITTLIKYFSNLNFKIATIKQSDKSYDIDQKGKDTYKYSKNGSNVIAFLTKDQTSFIFNSQMDIINCIEYILINNNYDLILIEGANNPNIPKIRIGNKPLIENTIFTFDNKDINRVQSLIYNKLIERCNQMKNNIELKVNGKKIPLTDFPNEFIKNTLIGMVKSLKGIDESDEIQNINIIYSK